MHETVTAIRQRKTVFRTRIASDCTKSSILTICTSCSLDEQLERLESACMLSSVKSAFRESSKIVSKVLMVTGGQVGYHPSEFQGLKGWRRRWIHSAITYN